MAAEPARFVLVKLSSLGDVVHALPVAVALRARFPRAHLAWMVEWREAVLLRRHPAIDEVIAVDTRRWRRARRPGEALAGLRALAALGRRLRDARFDVAIDLQGLVKSGLLTGATRAPLRIGFAAPWCRERLNALFTTRRVTPPPGARHVVEQYLALLAPLGIQDATVAFDLPHDAAADARMDAFLGAAGIKPRQRLVVLNPGAGRPTKRWPVDRFGRLAARLTAEADATVLVVWGPSEEAAAREIVRAGGGRPLLVPPTDLDDLQALVRRASVLVAGDTGPLHLAAALGTPCVGLYGPTPAVRNAPWGAGNRALASPDGTMAAIEVAAVLEAVLDLLGG